MLKVILVVTVGAISIATLALQPTRRHDDVQQADSLWTKVVPGQGFGPWLVFSCSTQGVLGVTVIRHDETVTEMAETAWGSGEQIWIEHPEEANCECKGFSELGSCHQGRAMRLRKP